MPDRKRSEAPRIDNLHDLEEAFSPYRVEEKHFDDVRKGNAVPSQLLFFDSTWGESYFTAVFGSTDMLKSLHAYIERGEQFAIYLDAQHKLARSKVKTLWIGGIRTRFDHKTKKYVHSFTPFCGAFAAEEAEEVYTFMLRELDGIVHRLTRGQKELGDLVALCVHDAHRGAIAACEKVLPEARNSRCFFHLTKSVKDNKARLGEAFDLVRGNLFTLHVSPSDEILNIVTRALIREAELLSDDAAGYLSRSLDYTSLGYPNITLTSSGLQCTQILTDVVETFNKTMRNAMGRKKPPLNQVVAKLIKAFKTLKGSTVNFVSDSADIVSFGYRRSMKLKGTELFRRRYFREVTEDMERITEQRVNSRFFLFTSLDFGAQSRGLSKKAMLFSDDADRYIRATCGSIEESDEIKQRYFGYNLVSVRDDIGKGGENGENTYWIICNCKTARDWAVCAHTYACEIELGEEKPYIPAKRKINAVRSGPRTQRKIPTLSRHTSGVTVPRPSSATDTASINSASLAETTVCDTKGNRLPSNEADTSVTSDCTSMQGADRNASAPSAKRPRVFTKISSAPSASVTSRTATRKIFTKLPAAQPAIAVAAMGRDAHCTDVSSASQAMNTQTMSKRIFTKLPQSTVSGVEPEDEVYDSQSPAAAKRKQRKFTKLPKAA
ncbi:hypothetical protein FOZ62_026126 [Perkinsus olseni]|uniref:SWIM-type domain-containing protein n=1 Tax=Perkinsus olseni TaxID=32597 RepID=A0A7J6S631_PEROL|nr:hypothetical protein FOZ62_026126 [Perkinsus olseni]